MRNIPHWFLPLTKPAELPLGIHPNTWEDVIRCEDQYILRFYNSLAPGKFKLNFRHVIFKQILVIDGWGISCEIALIWTSLDFTVDQSTLVQVMAWCCQATSHYLSQCWPRSLSPYGITRPQWVKSYALLCWFFFRINILEFSVLRLHQDCIGRWKLSS